MDGHWSIDSLPLGQQKYNHIIFSVYSLEYIHFCNVKSNCYFVIQKGILRSTNHRTRVAGSPTCLTQFQLGYLLLQISLGIMFEFVLSFSTNYVLKKLLILNRANDGKFHTLTTSSPHCMHTIEEPGEYHPWWLVDLGGQYHVETVIVTNKGDSAFGNFAILTLGVHCELSNSN